MIDEYGLGQYSKNPYPLRNRIIPNEATVRAQEPLDGIMVSGVPAVAKLGIMPSLNGYGFLLLSHDPCGNEGHWMLGNCTFPNTPPLH